jgi:DNA-binding transcriptional MocR family regulator
MMKKDIYQRIKPSTIAEEIILQVQQLIKDGQLQPGEQLPPEREFAEVLGVGRPSLREALSTTITCRFCAIITARSSKPSKTRMPSAPARRWRRIWRGWNGSGCGSSTLSPEHLLENPAIITGVYDVARPHSDYHFDIPPISPLMATCR